MIEFRNSNQLRAFMKKEGERLHFSPKNVYTTFVARAFLEKLAKKDNGLILVKGSSAETAYLGHLVRGITDVDIASPEGMNVSLPALKSIIDDNEGTVSFTLSKTPRVTPTGIYQMSFDSTFMTQIDESKKTKQSIGVDFQENYNRLIEKEKRVMPKIFEGDEEFEITVPSFEEYLAEKLCIIVESNKTDVLNTRVKDFYDIYQLHGGKYDPAKLTEYFKKMLILRGKIKMEDATTVYLDKDFVMNHEDVWDSTREKYDFLDHQIDLYGAVYYSRAVIREELQKNGVAPANPFLIKKK